MKWEKSGETAMRCAPWTVAKVSVKGVNFYELWQDGKPHQIGLYASFEVAKHAITQIEIGGQG